MSRSDWSAFDEYAFPARPHTLPMRCRVWWRRHHETVLALLIIAVFVLYLGFEIARAHVAGRL